MSSADGPVKILSPQAGRLLVSNPRMLDPNFMHTVVFLCDHDDLGSYGLVLNRPAGRPVRELGSSLPLLAERDDPLWIGGPVASDTLQVLHGLDVPIEGTHAVLPDVYLGGEPDALHRALEDRGDDDAPIRFVLGYSGWSAGQLAGEMREGAWLVCEARPEFVFDREPETLWRRVLRAKGGPFAGMADLPPDPTWN